MIVGKIELRKDINQFKLRSDIENLLRSRWLDNETHREFTEQLYKMRDPLGLLALKNSIEKEIEFLKKRYSA